MRKWFLSVLPYLFMDQKRQDFILGQMFLRSLISIYKIYRNHYRYLFFLTNPHDFEEEQEDWGIGVLICLLTSFMCALCVSVVSLLGCSRV